MSKQRCEQKEMGNEKCAVEQGKLLWIVIYETFSVLQTTGGFFVAICN